MPKDKKASKEEELLLTVMRLRKIWLDNNNYMQREDFALNLMTAFKIAQEITSDREE